MGILARCCRGGGCRVVDGLRVPRFPGDGDERMSAVVALIDAVVAVAPIAFITVVALPIAGIGIRSANVTEDAYFYSLLGIVLAHEHMRWGRRFRQRRHWSAIPMSNENMWVFMIRWIASFGRFTFVTRPSGPSKAVPVLASFAETIAAETEIVLAIVTTAAVVVEFILYAIFPATLARYMWFCVEYRGTQCCRRSLS